MKRGTVKDTRLKENNGRDEEMMRISNGLTRYEYSELFEQVRWMEEEES